MTAPLRHPWLESLHRDPAGQLRALVDGLAAITPYERAEPDDAAAMVLGALATDDPARDDFDQGCLATLEALRQESRQATAEDLPFVALAQQRLLLVIRRLRPPATIADLHRRYVYWHDSLESCVIDHSLDPLREFWRLLALTQDQAPDHAPRRLMALWLDACTQAGPYGRFDSSYLDVGLLGLRKLPIGGDIASNEEAVCHGLALWAAHQLPDRKSFEARWWEIETAYPRSPDFWPPLVTQVLAAAKEKLDGQDFPASIWWRDLTEAEDKPASQRTLHGVAADEDGPPPAKRRTDILADIAQPIRQLQPRIESLMAAHRRYADASGDTFYLIRTACYVGQRLIEHRDEPEQAPRGRVAVTLARQALDYQPANPFAWSLWRDGLDAAGHGAAAEAVGWEALRRFPENKYFGAQLAKLLCSHGRFDDALNVLKRNCRLFPTNAHGHAQLANVLADHFGRYEQAVATLENAITLCPDNQELSRLLGKAKARQRLTKPFPIRPIAQEDTEVPPFPAVPAKRALMGWQMAANDDERDQALAAVRQALAADPGLAYHRYVAALTGLAATDAGGGVFAIAFARAMATQDETMLQAMAAKDGLHATLARLALATTRGEAPPDLALPDAPSTQRIKVVVQGIADPATNPQDLSWLLADFAASELSLSAPQELIRA